jgi:hypothetical protein
MSVASDKHVHIKLALGKGYGCKKAAKMPGMPNLQNG